MDKLELKAPILKDGDLDILINSVNPVRLKTTLLNLKRGYKVYLSENF